MTYQNFDHPTSNVDKVQQFTGIVASSDIATWVAWNKPANIKGIHVYMLGGGAGGGGGGASAAATAGGGGSGGCAGSISSIILPAYALPDVLYIKCGIGGTGGTGQVQGGAASTNGTAGGNTYLSITPSTTSSDVILYAVGGTAGNAGSGATFGAAPTNTAAAVITSMKFFAQGIYLLSQVTGGVGTAGGFGGVSLTISNTNNDAIVLGGTGGGSVNAGTSTSTGGSITRPSVAGIASLSAISGAGLQGNSHITSSYMGSENHKLSYGGTGGNGNTSAGVGGKGGDADIGSGGGGGGGSNGTASVGGAGGSGGPGFVVITCW